MVPSPAASDDRGTAAPARSQRGLSLFWRTFFLLALLLVGSILAWLQTLRSLELEPRASRTAQQIASLVNLSRAALIHADAINRVSLIKTMRDQESLRIVPREPGDTFEPFDTTALGRRITLELQGKLGPGTLLANSVNREEGLWVGFTIDEDGYWMLTDRSRVDDTGGRTWTIWLITAAALSLGGAAVIARLINRPLKKLASAARRVRYGNFDPSELDESVATNEIRAVNIGFNRMTRTLAKVEQDRAIMLAGISHDLRTPLARLRLETELSVADEQARSHMAADLEQLDAIIGKFLDYARPGGAKLETVALREVIETCLYYVQQHTNMQVKLDLHDPLLVLADPVELGRVITNLLENADRYGKSADTNIAVVHISARTRDPWVRLKVRDHGAGVPDEQLGTLMTPFYRAEAARTAANGAGLGLAIVEKIISRMGGTFKLSNAPTGGLVARIKLQRAPTG